MKKVLLLMAIFALVMGCAHLEKEAIQKGYASRNPSYSYTLEVIGVMGGLAARAGNPYSSEPITYYSEQRLIWDETLFMKNYPECYIKDERELYCGWEIPFNCVGEKVENEGRWR